MNALKAFQVDDYTWWAAATADEAIQSYFEETGEVVEDGYPTEVTDAMLDAEIPEFDENEAPTGNMTTMRAFLNEATGPGFLATSEF